MLVKLDLCCCRRCSSGWQRARQQHESECVGRDAQQCLKKYGAIIVLPTAASESHSSAVYNFSTVGENGSCFNAIMT